MPMALGKLNASAGILDIARVDKQAHYRRCQDDCAADEICRKIVGKCHHTRGKNSKDHASLANNTQ